MLFTALATVHKDAWPISTFRASPAAWAFATAGQKDASLFVPLATAAERRMGDLNAQELANTAWAFATAG